MKTRIVLFLIIAIAAHVATVWGLPRGIVLVVRDRLRRSVGDNAIHHAPLPDETWRTIVMPSPDLLYSACAYDVAMKPLYIDAELPPETYWSLSAFSDTTDNFFVINDAQIKPKEPDKPKQAHLMLTSRADARSADRTIIYAPTPTGILLFRILVKDKKDLPELRRIQQLATCKPQW